MRFKVVNFSKVANFRLMRRGWRLNPQPDADVK